MPGLSLTPEATLRTASRMRRFLAVFGPGLVVMLADTDVGSVITAGQSGVQWGYRLLMLQLVLVPILYMVQELTVRLAIFTGRGHGELIRETFGPFWAWVSALGLGCRQRRGAADGILRRGRRGGALWACPATSHCRSRRWLLLAVVITGSYRRVERVRDRGRAVRAGVLLRRLGGASLDGRTCWRVRRRYPLPEPGLSVSGGGQYRRGGDAVDGVLPAVRRGR